MMLAAEVAMVAARLLLVVALAGVARVASAHHGSAISYDLSKQVTLTVDRGTGRTVEAR